MLLKFGVGRQGVPLCFDDVITGLCEVVYPSLMLANQPNSSRPKASLGSGAYCWSCQFAPSRWIVIFLVAENACPLFCTTKGNRG